MNIYYYMSPEPPKAPQRAFPWREGFLAAIRDNPRNISLACKRAGISRNSAYAHWRRHTAFRRQWMSALDTGYRQLYREHGKRLAADPQIQRAMRRAEWALQWRRDHPGTITDYHN